MLPYHFRFQGYKYLSILYLHIVQKFHYTIFGLFSPAMKYYTISGLCKIIFVYNLVLCNVCSIQLKEIPVNQPFDKSNLVANGSQLSGKWVMHVQQTKLLGQLQPLSFLIYRDLIFIHPNQCYTIRAGYTLQHSVWRTFPFIASISETQNNSFERRNQCIEQFGKQTEKFVQKIEKLFTNQLQLQKYKSYLLARDNHGNQIFQMVRSQQ